MFRPAGNPVPIVAIADEIEADYFGAPTGEERETLRLILGDLAERCGLSNMPVD